MKLKFIESDDDFAKRAQAEYDRLTNIAQSLSRYGALSLGSFGKLDWLDAAEAVLEKRNRIAFKQKRKGKPPSFCHGTVAQMFISMTHPHTPARARLKKSEAIRWFAEKFQEVGMDVDEDAIKKALQRQGVIGKKGT